VESWLERESRSTKLPKGLLLESLAEESIRARRFPGLGFRGAENSRRAWVIGSALDVWELVELYRGKGREQLLEEHNVSERQLELALSYRDEHPREIEEAIEENSRAPEEWRRLNPALIPLPPEHLEDE
jgi:uncharacterized protein (DUF433 family)